MGPDEDITIDEFSKYISRYIYHYLVLTIFPLTQGSFS